MARSTLVCRPGRFAGFALYARPQAERHFRCKSQYFTTSWLGFLLMTGSKPVKSRLEEEPKWWPTIVEWGFKDALDMEESG